MQIPWLPQASLMLQLAIRSSPLWQGHQGLLTLHPTP